MLLDPVWRKETVQYETSQFIDSTCMIMHGWFKIYVVYGSHFVTLSGDQNEVFEYLVLQSLLLTANFRNPTIKRFFLFQNLTFTVWSLCILKLFLLWRRQKYQQISTLNTTKVNFHFSTLKGKDISNQSNTHLQCYAPHRVNKCNSYNQQILISIFNL